LHSNIAVVEAYLEGLQKQDLSEVPIADGILYQNPLTGEPIEGKHNVIRFLQAFLPAIQRANVVQHVAQDEHVASLVEWETTFGVLTVFHYIRIEEGIITELRSFFDPREMLERMGTHGGN
jgi:limonene-1,2-epoxide hydrolase